jgi:Ras-related GTP-binding protein C/D
MDSLERLHTYIMDILPHKPSINFEIFIHKCDALSDDFRHDIYRDIEMRMTEDLADSHVFSALMNFSQTSVYDKTLHDAFSRVLQKVIPELPTLASLLDSLCANSNYIKAYLFDTRSNLYVASDTTPGSLSIYESCADYLDMISEFSAIYGWMSSKPAGGKLQGENGVVTESLVTMEKGHGASGMCCREINKYLTLVAMLANEGPGKAKPMMDWNMGVVCKSIGKVLDMTMGRAKEYREREGPYVSEEERVKIPAGRGRRLRG